MAQNQAYKDHLKKLDKNLTIILLSIIVILIISFISKETLYHEKNNIEYKKLSEFLDNQEIFHKYFNQKRDLYAELNQVALDSSGESEKEGELPKYSLSFDLFSGIKGPWGWDESRLDNRYSYNEIVKDIFIHDFHFWSNKHWISKKVTNNKGKPVPDSLVRDFFDMERRLYKIVKNKNYILNFFINNLEIKLLFFKDIIQKYNISFPDTLPMKLPKKIGDLKLEKSISEFLNDSIRHSFYVDRLFFMRNIGLDFYFINETYESICDTIFQFFIKDKFLIYDKNIFSNKLPYSSYVDKMKRQYNRYEKIIETQSSIPIKIDSPIIKIEINMILFYKSVFFILLVCSYLIKNIFKYRDYLITKLKISFDKEVFNEYQYPYLVHLVVLNHKNKNLALKFLTIFVQLFVIVILIFGIALKFYDIIYFNFIYFFILAVMPVLIILYICTIVLIKKTL